MQVADESPKWNVIGDGLNGERGFFRSGNVVEHFQNARHAENEHEEDSGAACSERMSPACLFGWDGWGVEVVEEGGAHMNVEVRMQNDELVNGK